MTGYRRQKSGAKGSTKSWGANDSRVCCHCGGKLAITGTEALWMHHDPKTGARSSHVRCGSPLQCVSSQAGPGGRSVP